MVNVDAAVVIFFKSSLPELGQLTVAQHRHLFELLAHYHPPPLPQDNGPRPRMIHIETNTEIDRQKILPSILYSPVRHVH